ncbi:MAG: glycine cleavage system protein GcvH [Planctomycetota bacterium]
MSAPDDRRYLASHEWHKPEGDLVVIGISQTAVDELTDITYLEVTTDSGPIDAGATFGEIESVKATSELYAGVAGEIVEVNQEVIDNPALINDDCYGQGWIIKIKPTDADATASLLSAADYQANQAD